MPLPYQGATIGALNIYSTQPAAFASTESLAAGLEAAEVIAVAVANADAHWQLGEQARNMRLAMDSRAVIEQAKGVLMAQRRVNAEQAFEILREASQRYNRKLRDIALGIVESDPAAEPLDPAPIQGRPAATRGTPPPPGCPRDSATSTAVGAADTTRRSTRVWPRPAPSPVSTTTSRRTVPSVPGRIASVTASASCTTTPVVP